MLRHDAENASVTALLGPTNTGKTHFAVERMLAHRTGMMGFPLRLLAREVYDRVAAEKGTGAVALVTGEEKKVPARPRYFVCTVEAMPLDREVDFLAVDEIQLAGDPERGHIFTDRLLRARGAQETLFLGADTMRPAVRVLTPEARLTSRPRLSELGHAGHCKLSRLEPRNAVIAFSAESIYATAERVRELRGGCAVVLGALSPRTRNAQVALYQSGEVDSIVATDAIGMGLNLDLSHVAFSARRKFDGRSSRALSAAEIAQIAGRAGRNLANGTFGTTGEAAPFEPALAAAVESHGFPPLSQIYWRNAALRFDSVGSLLESLDTPPPAPGLRQMHGADDHRTLAALAREPEIAATLTGPARVRLLWEACQIPDFRKTLAEDHLGLVRRLYLSLAESGRLPSGWVERALERLARTDGDIDTLTARISHVRTWTYISNRTRWVDDDSGLEERARALEDSLSDALHTRLTQRFVDRRATLLRPSARSGRALFVAVDEDGEVTVEGHRAGTFEGFHFRLDADAARSRALTAAANRAVGRELAQRVAALETADDEAFALGLDPDAAAPGWGEIAWRGAPVARLARGDGPLQPAVLPLHGDQLSAGQRERVRRRLAKWLKLRLARDAAPLYALQDAPLEGVARGVAFAVSEALGCLPRRALAPQLASLDRAGRRNLTQAGLRFGTLNLFIPAMLKPARARLAGLLWWAWNAAAPPPPLPGRAVSVARDGAVPDACYGALGFVVLGPRAIRADIAERLVQRLRKAARAGPFPVDTGLLVLAGSKRESFPGILHALGYEAAEDNKGGPPLFVRRKTPKRAFRRRRPAVEPDSPFAKLGALTGGAPQA